MKPRLNGWNCDDGWNLQVAFGILWQELLVKTVHNAICGERVDNDDDQMILK